MKIYKYLFARIQRVKIFLLNAFIKNLAKKAIKK